MTLTLFDRWWLALQEGDRLSVRAYRSHADDEYPVFDVTQWESVAPEPMGSKGKEWLEDEQGAWWLFKSVRIRHDAKRGWRLFGEDWSERIASAVAMPFGVPTARVELATREKERGTISRSVLPDHGHELEHGNELMQRFDPTY